MRQLLVLTKKELNEQWKNKRALSLFLVLLLLAVASPLMAKYLPEMLAPMLEGTGVTLPPVSFLDSYAQYFANMEQIILIMTIVLYSNVVSAEVKEGTIALPLSKGLPRFAVVLGKYLALSIVWIVIYTLCSGVFFGITQIVFPQQAPQHLLPAFACMGVFFLFLQAVVVFFSSMVKKSFLAMIGSGAVMVVLYLLNIIPKSIRYSPLATSARALPMIGGNAEHIVLPLVIALSLIPILIGAGMILFGKREI